jgi:Na+/H+ antiporter NhaC
MIKTHTGIRIGELGEVLGALGGLALLLGGMTPFMKRAGQMLGGLGITAGFVLLVVATHWGHFH